jgi:SAM-dependent methyltransferase
MMNHRPWPDQICPLCKAKARWLVGRQDFVLYACQGCGIHFRVFALRSEPQSDHFTQVDMPLYSRSVQVARERSYQQLLDAVQLVVPTGRWLDVGCSFGWLLNYARTRGFEPHGIEPSPGAAAAALSNGLQVTIGLYPDTDPISPPYQVISFMDVLEHLVDPCLVLRSARSQLIRGGALVVQLPDRECFMYRMAVLMFRFSGGRWDAPLRRLYLDGLDFPHVYYHSRKSLRALLEQNGFVIAHEYRAPTGSWDTMIDRVTYLEQPAARALSPRWTALGAGVLQVLDNMWGHGGLLVMIAK